MTHSANCRPLVFIGLAVPEAPTPDEFTAAEIEGRPALDALYKKLSTPEAIRQILPRGPVVMVPQRPKIQTPALATRAKVEKVGRNDPCPCKSGRKFKICCMGRVVAAQHRARAARAERTRQ